jgi:hypothetical protein
VRTRVQRGLGLLRERLDADSGRDMWTAGLLPLLGTASTPVPLVVTGAAIMIKKTAVWAALVLVSVLVFWGWSAWRESDTSPGSRGERSAATGRTVDEESNGADTSPAAFMRAPVDRDRDLFGVVVDGEGGPIADALVRIGSRPWLRANALLAETHTAVPGPEARTQQDGTFRVRLRRGQLVNLVVEAEGYATVAVRQCQAGERVRVKLARAAAVTVRIRDGTGVPMRGVEVKVWRPRVGRRPVFSVSARTGVDGRCVLGGLPIGDAMLRVGGADPVACEVPGTIDLSVPELRTVIGVVRDAETGVPIDGARVGPSWKRERTTATDLNGCFAYLGVAVRELHANAPGYGSARKLVPPIGAVDFELSRGDSVEGRVLDQAGKPVAGAYVVAMASRHTNTGQEIDTRSARTAADGTFLVDGIRHDLPHTLIVHADGHAKQLVDVAPHPDAPGLIVVGDVRLPAPRSLEGRVLTEAGEPVVACRVVVESTETHYLDSYYCAREERRTDDLGRFRFPELASGAYTVEAKVRGREPIRTEVTILSERDAHDIVLRIRDGRVLSLTLIGDDGVPATGVHIAVEGQRRHEAQTDAKGHAVLHEVPDGDVALRFWPGRPRSDDERGWLAGEALVSAGETKLRATLRVTRPIRGTVLSPGSEPLLAVIVQAVQDEDEPIAEAVSDRQGRFTLFVPVGQPIDLLVDGRRSGGRRGPPQMLDLFGLVASVSAPAKGVTIRTGAMPADRSLTVRVAGPTGVALRGIEVVLHDANTYPRPDPAARHTTSDLRGNAVFSGLPRRRVRIEVKRSDALPSRAVVPEQEVVLPRGQHVDISFRRGVAYRFAATAPNGAPIAGAQVRLSTMAGVTLTIGRTDADGVVTLYGAPNTVHQIYAAYVGASGVKSETYSHDLHPSDQPISIRFKR